jgi:hypothetical protein
MNILWTTDTSFIMHYERINQGRIQGGEVYGVQTPPSPGCKTNVSRAVQSYFHV